MTEKEPTNKELESIEEEQDTEKQRRISVVAPLHNMLRSETKAYLAENPGASESEATSWACASLVTDVISAIGQNRCLAMMWPEQDTAEVLRTMVARVGAEEMT